MGKYLGGALHEPGIVVRPKVLIEGFGGGWVIQELRVRGFVGEEVADVGTVRTDEDTCWVGGWVGGCVVEIEAI